MVKPGAFRSCRSANLKSFIFDVGRVAPVRLSHSVRSAAIGLIRVARRAGSQVASNAAIASTTGASVNANGSSELTSKRMLLAIFPVPRARRSPSARPAATIAKPSRRIIHWTCLALRTERHPDSDLARPPRDRIRFDAINADDGEPEREGAEDGEQGRAGPDNPQLRIVIHVLFERPQLENRQHRIDAPHRPAQQVRRGGFTARGERSKFYEEENIALKTPREGQIERAARLLLEHSVFRRRHNPDDLDRFSRA